MSLVATEDRVNIAACAEIIVGKRPANEEINLYTMVHRFHGISDDIVADLAQHVEALSKGTRTVRRANNILFAHRAMGPYLYLASCHVSNPEPVIETTTGDVQLVGLGPYRNGFEFPATQASFHAIATARARNEQDELRRALRNQASEQAQQYSNKLVTRLLCRLLPKLDSPQVSEATREQAVQLLGTEVTLESIAAACVCIGISLDILDPQT